MGEESIQKPASWNKLVIVKNNDDWNSPLNLKHNEIHYNMHSIFDIYDEPRSTQGKSEVDNLKGVGSQSIGISSEVPKRRRGRKSSGPKGESAEERAARLARMSAYAAQRLAAETPEQRATRLQRMSHYAARRLAHESDEQRAKRLSRMSSYAAKRLSQETPEQRKTRLARMSAYAAKRQALKKHIKSAALNIQYSTSETSNESEKLK